MKKAILYVSVMMFSVLFSFQNCSLVSSSHTSLSSFGKTCMAAAQSAFMETYYPHMRANCTSCHDNGGIGIGWFASKDPSFAFDAFMSTGREKINTMMVYDGHPGPYNGPDQQGFIDQHRARWEEVDVAVSACAINSNLETKPSNTPVGQVNAATGDPNRRPWRILEWDLFTGLSNPDLAGKLHLIVRIQYREAQSGGVDIGYEFRSPMARIRADAPADTQYAIDGLSVLRNGVLLSTVTAFHAIDDFVVGLPTDTLLIDSGASPGIVSTKNLATDTFALRFAEIRDANGLPIGTDPGTGGGGGGGGGMTVPARVTYDELINPNNALGYLGRSCVNCHNAGNPAGALNLQTYAGAMAAAAAIKSRVNNANRPMPTGGLLPQFERDVISRWVDIGAPQN